MTDKRKIAVVGGGAAGLTAAGRAAALGCEVTVFERNAAPGKKLGITGKGEGMTATAVCLLSLGE